MWKYNGKYIRDGKCTILCTICNYRRIYNPSRYLVQYLQFYSIYEAQLYIFNHQDLQLSLQTTCIPLDIKFEHAEGSNFQFFTVLSSRKRRIPRPVESVVDRFYIVQVDMFWLDDKTSPENRAGVVIDVNEEEHRSCSRRARRRWKCIKKKKECRRKKKRRVHSPWTLKIEQSMWKPMRKSIISQVSGSCVSRHSRSLSHRAVSVSTILSVSLSSSFLLSFFTRCKSCK